MWSVSGWSDAVDMIEGCLGSDTAALAHLCCCCLLLAGAVRGCCSLPSSLWWPAVREMVGGHKQCCWKLSPEQLHVGLMCTFGLSTCAQLLLDIECVVQWASSFELIIHVSSCLMWCLCLSACRLQMGRCEYSPGGCLWQLWGVCVGTSCGEDKCLDCCHGGHVPDSVCGRDHQKPAVQPGRGTRWQRARPTDVTCPCLFSWHGLQRHIMQRWTVLTVGSTAARAGAIVSVCLICVCVCVSIIMCFKCVCHIIMAQLSLHMFCVWTLDNNLNIG